MIQRAKKEVFGHFLDFGLKEKGKTRLFLKDFHLWLDLTFEQVGTYVLQKL